MQLTKLHFSPSKKKKKTKQNKTTFLNCPIGVPCLMFSLQRAKFCKAHLLEAWWFSSGYIPTVNEYLENACISVGGFAATVHAYILQGCTFTKNSFHCIENGTELANILVIPHCST